MTVSVQVLRDSLGICTRLLAGRDIVVTQSGHNAFVAFDKTTGRPQRVNIPYIPDNADEGLLQAIQGFLDHEVAHLLFSDFEALRQGNIKKVAEIHNLIEDSFIEREVPKVFPGSALNLDRLREFMIKEIVDPEFKKRLNAGHPPQSLFLALGAAVVRAWAGQKQFVDYMKDKWALIEPVISLVDPDLIARVPQVKHSWDTLELAEGLQKALMPPPSPPTPSKSKQKQDKKDCKDKQQSQSEGGSDQDQDQDGEEGDSAEKPSKSKSKSKKQKDGADEKNDANDETKDDANDEDGKDKKSGKSKKKADGEKDEESESKGPDTDEGEEEAAGSESEEDEKGAGSGDKEDEQESESEEDEGDSGSESDPDEGEDEESEADENEGEGDSGDDEFDADEHEDDAEEGDGDGGAGKPDKQEGASSEPDDEEGDGEGEQDEESTPSDAEAPPQEDGDGSSDMREDDAGKPGDEVAEERKAAFLTEEELRQIKGTEDGLAEKIQERIIPAMKESNYLVYTTEYDEISTPPEGEVNGVLPREVQQLCDKTEEMVGVMSKDLERAIFARSRVLHTPGHRSGKLHGPNLFRLGLGDTRVFRRKEEHKSRDVAFELVCDNSGSMRGPKVTTAMYAGYALSAVLERLKIKHEVIGFTTRQLPYEVSNELAESEAELVAKGVVPKSAGRYAYRAYSRREALYMPIFKGVEERLTPDVRKRFVWGLSRNALMNNVDGECIELAYHRLLKIPATRRAMIVLSDGSPNCHAGMGLEHHLKSKIEEIERSGVDVLGIGIQDNSVQYYYKRNVVLWDINDLPAMVMGEISRHLLDGSMGRAA